VCAKHTSRLVMCAVTAQKCKPGPTGRGRGPFKRATRQWARWGKLGVPSNQHITRFLENGGAGRGRVRGSARGDRPWRAPVSCATVSASS